MLNTYGEKAEIDGVVFVTLGSNTRRAYGIQKNEHLLLKIYCGTIVNVSPNGNPLVRLVVHDTVHVLWYAKSNWSYSRDNIELLLQGGRKPKETLSAAKKKFVSSIKDCVNYCTVAGYFDGRKYIKEHTYCHSFLRRGIPGGSTLWNYCNPNPDERVSKTFSAFIDNKNKENLKVLKKDNDEHSRAWLAFVEFLNSDSLFSQAWKTKDYNTVLLEGWEVDLQCPQALAMTALIASRVPYERPEGLLFWYKLTQRGMNPRTALLLQDDIQILNSGYRFRRGDRNHQVFDRGRMRISDIKRMLEGKVNKEGGYDRPLYRGYLVVNDSWVKTPVQGSSLSTLLKGVKYPDKIKKETFFGTSTIEFCETLDELAELACVFAKKHKIFK